MIAGTLGTLDPVEERLESWCRNDGMPALEVRRTQETLDESSPQAGKAACRVKENRLEVTVHPSESGITTTREPHLTAFATDWYADVTGTGVVLAESIPDPDEKPPFPFDLISTQAGSEVERVAVDVPKLKSAWSDAGVLTDVWMTGSSVDGLEAQLNYHQAANSDDESTIGLGFKRGWNGTIIRGVVYEAGYVALYSASHTEEAVAFIDDELLPYTYGYDPEEFEDQTDFDEFGDGGDG